MPLGKDVMVTTTMLKLTREELSVLQFLQIRIPDRLTQDQVERLKSLLRGSKDENKPDPAYTEALVDDINAKVRELSEIDPWLVECLPVFNHGYREGLCDAHEVLLHLWEN